MNFLEHVSQNIIDLHVGGNWTGNSIAEEIEDVSLEESQILTLGSPNTIAALLQHITYWNRIMVIRLGGIAVKIADHNGFDANVFVCEKDWDMLKKDIITSAFELADAIKVINFTDLLEEILPNQPTTFKSIIGISEHAHYHLGQIVILKNLVRMAGGKNF